MRATLAGQRIFAILSVLGLWFGITWLFWVGYVGVDDLFYSKYAYMLHRPPMIWWEFRMPFILALRSSYALFGASEVAAAVPNLIASFGLFLATAWVIGWPRKLTWETNLTMILAAMMPLDVSFRSWPGATFFAGSLCGIATACWLRGNHKMVYLGSALFALAFNTHETTVFYISIFCGLSLLQDWKRFFKPALFVGLFVAINLCAEGFAYQHLLGDPLARHKIASGGATSTVAGFDADVRIGGLRFYLWPLEILATSKHFAGSLLLLFISGAIAWRKLERNQKLLLFTVFCIWAWMGWGTMVPWMYKPFFRQFHYYGPLLLGINTLLPATVFLAFPPRAARLILCTMVGFYFVAASVGGRWGQNFDASRALLEYADRNPSVIFLTDVSTMNQMYTMKGFKLPSNVVCKNSEDVNRHLLVNKEPEGVAKFSFQEVEPQAILVNTEGPSLFAYDEAFAQYVRNHPGRHEVVLPARRKWLIALIPGFANRPEATLSLGAEVIYPTP